MKCLLLALHLRTTHHVQHQPKDQGINVNKAQLIVWYSVVESVYKQTCCCASLFEGL